MERIDDLISPLIKKGQSINHIFASHADEIGVSEKTLYTYINDNVFVFTAGTKEYYAFKKDDGFVTIPEANLIINECRISNFIDLDQYGWVFYGYEFLNE